MRVFSEATMKLIIAAAKDERERPKVKRIRRRPSNYSVWSFGRWVRTPKED